MAEIKLGPPYTGFRQVRRFLMPGDGLWSVANFTPSTGGVVLQSGANAGMAQPEGISVSAGYEREIIATKAGLHTFRVSVAVGPVSLLPRGDVFEQNQIDGGVRLMLRNVPNALAEFAVRAGTGSGFVGRNYGTRLLSITANLQLGAVYTLQLHHFLGFDYSPFVLNNAPYGEIIATYQETIEVTPA